MSKRTLDRADYELLEMLLWLRKHDRLRYYYWRVRIAYAAGACPIYLDRPPIRIGILYAAFVILFTGVIHVADFWSWWLAVAGGALAWSVALNGVLETANGYLQRTADIPGDHGGD